MGPYIAFIVVAGIVALIYRGVCEGGQSQDGGEIKIINWTPYLACLCIAIVCFVSCRDVTVGADNPNYLGSLHYYAGISWDEVFTAKLVWPYDYEPLYFLLTKICAHFCMSDHVFFFVIAILIYPLLFDFFNRYSDSPYVSFLVYCALGLFAYSLGVYRQMIALSICLFATRWIDSDEPLPFALSIAFAMAFHSSSICFALLWFYKKVDVMCLLKIAIPASFLFLALGRTLAMVAVRVFPQYAHFIGSKYDIAGGSFSMLMILLFIAVVVLYFLRNEGDFENCPRMVKVSVFALSLALCLQAASYSLVIMGRVLSYYTIFLAILIPYLMMHCFGKHGRVLSLYLVLPITMALFANSIASLI